jgi:hypothetical protein
LQYKEGDIVYLYENFRLSEGHLGIAKLVMKLEDKSRLTYITEDNYGSPRLQKVWSYEVWEVEIISSTNRGRLYYNMKRGDLISRKLKVFGGIGVPANSVEPKEPTKLYSDIFDNFEIVPGWGQCF